MTTDQILAQLWAIRSIVDALAANLKQPEAPSQQAGCSHPEDRREPASTLQGPPRFFCKDCRKFVTETLAPAEGE